MLRRLKRYRDAPKEVERLTKELAATQKRLALLRERAEKAESGTGDASRLLWIFGTGRSGTTWLAEMLSELPGVVHWGEPLVGALFGEFKYRRAAHKKGRHLITSEAHEGPWLRSARYLVLEGAAERFPDARLVVIKEPHGSIGAPVLSRALPESRMLVIVRDPRDVVASAADAHREGSWARSRLAEKKRLKAPSTAETNPLVFVRNRANNYRTDVGNSIEAYRNHEGPKTLIRYEDLRADTLSVLLKALEELEVSGDLTQIVEKHSWENIPEEERGAGKFYRKATPGGWKEDLKPKQIAVVEEICAPILEEFYS